MSLSRSSSSSTCLEELEDSRGLPSDVASYIDGEGDGVEVPAEDDGRSWTALCIAGLFAKRTQRLGYSYTRDSERKGKERKGKERKEKRRDETRRKKGVER
jgi:hypothetical protein